MNRNTLVSFISTLGFLSAITVAGKPPVPTPEDVPVLGEVDAFLLEHIYSAEDREGSLASICERPAFKALVDKHDLTLLGGPMLGSLTDTGAKIWVRTVAPAEVKVVVSPNKNLSSPVASGTARSTKNSDLTAILDIEGLKPFSLYYYDVRVSGKSAMGPDVPRFRTAPAKGQPARFDVGFGGGARYIHEKERIWDTIAERRPLAFLFLGDNIYIDEPPFPNKHRAMYYRRQFRPEFRRLGGGTTFYAIWDDHDFGANDCAGGLDPFKPDWKVPAWRVFKENWNNPYYGGGEKQPGCWFDFSLGDVDFFMTDGRYYRSFKHGTMLGPAQRQWLLDKLKASSATFKVIASGTLWTEHADKGGKDSWWGVKEEREEILSLIDRERIGGVLLISADRHRTDVYKIHRPDGYTLYEFETSKLTNNHTHGTKEKALFSYNRGNFYGLMTFDLTKKDPEMTFRCITIDGEAVYSLTLKRNQLQRAE